MEHKKFLFTDFKKKELNLIRCTHLILFFFIAGCSSNECTEVPYLYTEEVSLEDAYWSISQGGLPYFKGVRLKGVIEPPNCITPNITRQGFVVGLSPNPIFDLNVLSVNRDGGWIGAQPIDGKINTTATQFPPEYSAYWYLNVDELIGSKWYIRVWYEDENGHNYGNQVTFTIPEYP